MDKDIPPPPKKAKRVLSLRVGPQAQSEFQTRSKAAIDKIVKQTRTPWAGKSVGFSESQVKDLEKSLYSLQAELNERERDLRELEQQLKAREQEVAESEALLAAREDLVFAAEQSGESGGAPLTAEAEAALRRMKAELDAQQETLNEQREYLKERESFLQESEMTLFEKMQEQQVRETEIEQKLDDLRHFEQRRANSESE